MSSEKIKKIDFERFDRQVAGMQIYGILASPPYSALDKLKHLIIDRISDHLNNFDDISNDFKERVFKGRHDLLTLHGLVLIHDLIFETSLLNNLRAELLKELSGEDLMDMSIIAGSGHLDYIKETVQLDVLVSITSARFKIKGNGSIKELYNKLEEIILRLINKRQHD